MPAFRDVDQHRLRDVVVVPHVVGHELELGLDRAGVAIEGYDRRGADVLARTNRSVPRAGVAGRPEDQVLLFVVRARGPGGSTAAFPSVRAAPGVVAGLAGSGDRVGGPGDLSALGVQGDQPSAGAEFAAGHPGDDVALHDQRSAGDRDAIGVVGNLRIPDHFAGLGVQRDDVRVDGAEVDVVTVEDAAPVDHVAADDGQGLVRKLALVLPEEFTAARIQPEERVVRGGDHEHSVVFDRNDLVALRQTGRKLPDRHQFADIRLRDLCQRAEAVPVEGATVLEPVRSRRIAHHRRGDRTERPVGGVRLAERRTGCNRQQERSRCDYAQQSSLCRAHFAS